MPSKIHPTLVDLMMSPNPSFPYGKNKNARMTIESTLSDASIAPPGTKPFSQHKADRQAVARSMEDALYTDTHARTTMAAMRRAPSGNAMRSVYGGLFPGGGVPGVAARPNGFAYGSYNPLNGVATVHQNQRGALDEFGTYVHETTHGLQMPTGDTLAGFNVNYTLGTESARPFNSLSYELAPSFTSDLARYEVARRDGLSPTQTPVYTRLAPGYSPSMEYIRKQATDHGVFRGKSVDELLTTVAGKQFLKMLVQKHMDAVTPGR